MPTISQLPVATSVTPADELPVSQAGTTHSVSIGTLLAGTQPAIITETGSLLGRISLGAGSPETVAIGEGLTLNAGTLVASSLDLTNLPQQATLSINDSAVVDSGGTLSLLPLSALRGLFSAGANISIDANGMVAAEMTGSGSLGNYSITQLTPVGTIASSDLVAISQNGTDHTISYANLLDGLTIDNAQPAAPAADNDTLWVAQTSSTMLRQTFAAIWTWLVTKLPSYKRPVIEITSNTTLDGTIHNGRLLICSQPVTLTPIPLNMGTGFYCDVINLSGADVILGSGIVTSSGSAHVPSGQTAAISVVTYSGGTVVFASVSGTAMQGVSIQVPGQVTGLAATNPTISTMALAWVSPSSGGTVATYSVRWSPTGANTWTQIDAISGTSTTVSGLAGSTSYDFQVRATNAGSSSAWTASYTASTASGGNYSLSNINHNPADGSTFSINQSGIIAQISDDSASGDGTHTVPASVAFYWSNSNTVVPTAGAESCVQWSNAGHNLWVQYINAPGTVGSYYLWAVAKNASGSVVATYVWPSAFTVHT
jgi:hypothetical protein